MNTKLSEKETRELALSGLFADMFMDASAMIIQRANWFGSVTSKEFSSFVTEANNSFKCLSECDAKYGKAQIAGGGKDTQKVLNQQIKIMDTKCKSVLKHIELENHNTGELNNEIACTGIYMQARELYSNTVAAILTGRGKDQETMEFIQNFYITES